MVRVVLEREDLSEAELLNRMFGTDKGSLHVVALLVRTRHHTQRFIQTPILRWDLHRQAETAAEVEAVCLVHVDG